MLIRKMILLFVCISFCQAVVGNAQTLQVITDLSTKHQNCLDSGKHMLTCSELYYSEMDSMLHLAYENLKSRLSENGKTEIKAEQIRWLQKRDEYHKQTIKRYQKYVKSGEWGPEMYLMIYNDDEAEFVKKRVVELIKRLNSGCINRTMN